jgi:hypothetical protein
VVGGGRTSSAFLRSSATSMLPSLSHGTITTFMPARGTHTHTHTHMHQHPSSIIIISSKRAGGCLRWWWWGGARAGHDGGGGVGAVGGGGDDAHVALVLPAGLVVLLDAQQTRVLALDRWIDRLDTTRSIR